MQDGKEGNKHSGVRTIGSQPSQETFKVECEILLTEYTDSNLKVEAEYVSEGTMRDEWGWSEILCQFSLLAETFHFRAGCQQNNYGTRVFQSLQPA